MALSRSPPPFSTGLPLGPSDLRANLRPIMLSDSTGASVFAQLMSSHIIKLHWINNFDSPLAPYICGWKLFSKQPININENKARNVNENKNWESQRQQKYTEGKYYNFV